MQNTNGLEDRHENIENTCWEGEWGTQSTRIRTIKCDCACGYNVTSVNRESIYKEASPRYMKH